MRCARLSLLGMMVVMLTCGSASGKDWSVRSLWPFGKQQQQQSGPTLEAPASAKVSSRTRTKTRAISWPKVKMPSLWTKKKKSDPRYLSKNQFTKQPTTVQRIKGSAQKAWNYTGGRLMPSQQRSRPKKYRPKSTTKGTHSNWLPASWFKPIQQKSKGPQSPAEWIGQPRLEF